MSVTCRALPLYSYELNTFGGYTGTIRHDGRHVIYASPDYVLRAWDLEHAAISHTFRGHTGDIREFVMTPDGQRVVSGSMDCTLKVWDLESGEMLLTLSGHEGGIFAVSVTPDGQRAISMSEDNTLRVWDLNNGVALHTLVGHTVRLIAMAVTPDAKRLVSGSRDGVLKVWDLKSGAELRSLLTDPVSELVAMEDGKRIVLVPLQGSLKIWNLDSDAEPWVVPGQSSNDQSWKVTPDGRRALSKGKGRTLKVWDLEQGVELQTLQRHNSIPGSIISINISKSRGWGRLRVIKRINELVREWLHSFIRHLSCDLRGSRFTYLNDIGTSIKRFQEKKLKYDKWVVISRDLHLPSRDVTLEAWDLESGSALHMLKEEGWDKTVSPDGQIVVFVSPDNKLKVWDLEQHTVVYTLEAAIERFTRVTITPDKRWVISGLQDTRFNVCDLENEMNSQTLIGHQGRVSAIATTALGRLVSVARDDALKVWDIDNGILINRLVGYAETGRGIDALAVTPDGRHAVSLSISAGKLIVWDLQKEIQLCSIAVTSNAKLNAIAVTPDAQKVVLAFLNPDSLSVWNVETGKLQSKFERHTNAVNSVAVTPDGQLAVSVSIDHTIRVWCLENGKEIVTFNTDFAVKTCTIVPTCDCTGVLTIAAGDGSGILHVLRLEGYSLSPTELRKVAAK